MSAAIVFIHGLAKKPPPEKLREIWIDWLGRDNPMPSAFEPPNDGLVLEAEGITDHFVYWADVFYGKAYDTDYSAYESFEGLEVVRAEVLGGADAPAPAAVPANAREAAFLAGFEAKLSAQPVLQPAPPSTHEGAAAAGLEIASWLPEPIKQAVIKKAAMEAYYYLFDKEFDSPGGQRVKVRQHLRSLVLAQVAQARQQADRVIVVSHSMGTMLAYDVLRNCAECPPVDTLFTLGSPLGVQEVQDELKAQGQDSVDFPAEKLGHWINVYDPLDPVCGADPKFVNDYAEVSGKRVVDIEESNWGKWRHTITHYLAGTQLRRELRRAATEG